MPDYLMSPNSSEIDYEERILSLVTHVYVTDFKQRRLFDTLHLHAGGLASLAQRVQSRVWLAAQRR